MLSNNICDVFFCVTDYCVEVWVAMPLSICLSGQNTPPPAHICQLLSQNWQPVKQFSFMDWPCTQNQKYELGNVLKADIESFKAHVGDRLRKDRAKPWKCQWQGYHVDKMDKFSEMDWMSYYLPGAVVQSMIDDLVRIGFTRNGHLTSDDCRMDLFLLQRLPASYRQQASFK